MTNNTFEAFHLAANCVGIQSTANIFHLAHFLIECNRIPGDVVEFGCHAGHSAALMSVLTSKRMWVYDSFRGLPESGPGDKGAGRIFRPGYLTLNQQVLQHTFDHHFLPSPLICAKWFSEVKPDDLPDKIAFAHLDGDLDVSVTQSLNLVWPRMSPGAVALVHDYDQFSLPGVKVAVQKFIAGNAGVQFNQLVELDGSGAMQCTLTKL
jgi:hypothetical protein